MRQKGFTLIELLVVTAIISILAAILIGVLSHVEQEARIRCAASEIHQLVAAVQMYAEDYGTYPSGRGDSNDGTDCGDLIAALEDDVGTGPYCEWPGHKKDVTVPVFPNLLDPWGNSYRYLYPPTYGTGMGYNVWSIGPDKEDDTQDGSGEDDDVKNW